MTIAPLRRARLCSLAAASTAAVAAALCVAAIGCSPSDEQATGTQLAGMLLDPQLSEISGLAASRRHPDVLWLHDDGGNPARLFAVSDLGRRLATFRVAGVTKTDWEDIAAFELDGRHYLLVADTGDNGGLRRSLQLHVIEEPAALDNARLQPAWSIAFRWPDGARDCEAVAVDPVRREILLISKKREPPELFTLPLRPAGTGLQTAARVGELAGVPRADETAASARASVGHQVTAADVSPDGRSLAVMTYRHLLLYPRSGREGWDIAISRPPQVRLLPWLPQAEALGWAADGRSLYATGEFVPAPLYRVAP